MTGSLGVVPGEPPSAVGVVTLRGSNDAGHLSVLNALHSATCSARRRGVAANDLTLTPSRRDLVRGVASPLSIGGGGELAAVRRKHKQTYGRGQIAVMSICVDLSDQRRQGRAAPR